MAHRIDPVAQFLGNPPYTLEVQHRGDCGSPLVDESTKTCKSVRIAESFCSTLASAARGPTWLGSRVVPGLGAPSLEFARPDQIAVRDSR